MAGVYASAEMTGSAIDVITPATLGQYAAALGGSHGTDVTGGMIGKVQQMIQLVKRQPQLSVRIFSGTQPGVVQRLLIDPTYPAGTVIRHDD